MSGVLGISPLGQGRVGQAYRDGETLVVPRGASLPPFCVKCGAPATEHIQKSFKWHSPWLALLVFLGLLPYLVVVFAAQKSCQVVVPICDAHQKRRRNYLWIGLALLVACLPVADWIGTLAGRGGWLALAFLVLLIASLVFLMPLRSLLSPQHIDETRAIFKGAGENFLARLPTGPGASTAIP